MLLVPVDEIVLRHRPGNIKALCHITANIAKELHYGSIFNALGNCCQVDLVGKADSSLDDMYGILASGQTPHK